MSKKKNNISSKKSGSEKYTKNSAENEAGKPLENEVQKPVENETEKPFITEDKTSDGEKAVSAETEKAETVKEDVKKKRLDPRKKYKAMSAAFTVIFTAAVVVVNIIVGILTDRFGLRADLTAQRLYTLSSLTENYLDYFLNTDISITVTSSEKHFEDGGEYFKQVNELLKKISLYSNHISLGYLELEQNPDYAAKFSDEELTEACVVVENKNSGRYRVITPTDYFGLDDETAMYYYYYYGYIGSSLIEQEAVSAMLYVSDDDPAKVVFTEGFGEHSSDALQKLLDKNGYEVENVNLMTSEIPSDTDVLVIFAPKYDYNSQQLSKIDKFLDNNGSLGKNVFYFASSERSEMKNIDEFLSDWGMSVGYSVVGQTNPDYRILSEYIHLQQIEDTDFTLDSYQKGYIIGSDLCPVYIENGTSNETEVLMKTYDRAFLKPLGYEGEFDSNTAETGIFNDAVMSSKTNSEGVSRVCAIGSDTMAGNFFMSYENVANQIFFLGVFDTVCGKNKGISITPKSFETVYFEMTEGTANILAIVLCIVIPICIIVFGIVIYLRRRHR